jgi:hypothetical protein
LLVGLANVTLPLGHSDVVQDQDREIERHAEMEMEMAKKNGLASKRKQKEIRVGATLIL